MLQKFSSDVAVDLAARPVAMADHAARARARGRDALGACGGDPFTPGRTHDYAARDWLAASVPGVEVAAFGRPRFDDLRVHGARRFDQRHRPQAEAREQREVALGVGVAGGQAASRRRRSNWRRPGSTAPAVRRTCYSRPADSRTIERGISRRATAIVRTNSNGSSSASVSSGQRRAFDLDQAVDRHRIRMRGQVRQRLQQAGALLARFAQADDAAAAGLHADVAHVRQRVEAVLELAGVDDLVVELRRGVEVVVVVVEAGGLQRLRLGARQHAERGAGFQPERLHFRRSSPRPSGCRGRPASARPRPCRSARRRRPWPASPSPAPPRCSSAWSPRRRCGSAAPAGSTRSPRGSRRSSPTAGC